MRRGATAARTLRALAAVYPLASVQRLRDDEEEAARRALASAIERQARAAEAVAQCAQRRDEHVRVSETIQRDEAARDVAGRSVAETLTARAYLARRKRELAALTTELSELREQEAARAREVEQARAALAQARAEVEALAKHRAAWEAEQAKVRERREEAELDDRASRRR